MGLLKPVSGSVTLNGVDVYTIANAEKKNLFGYVDQNFFLVRGTVADQISLKDSSISREAIIGAIETVGLADYVNGLEKGLDTEVDGDALFSQGQIQLLSIARAIVSDPPILLLDEMTASLDSITEEKIVSVLQKAGAERTMLAISHRPSSMLSSDSVVILENGRVRDAGSPAELLDRDEWYKNYVSGERLADTGESDNQAIDNQA
jgi:ATP-binding cassette subfamily B protein